ncbi:MAG TPA: hypothetical protein VGL72_17190, partial [Bryobacteraceae bacterium]
ASYQAGTIAPEAIGTLFGSGLAAGTTSASDTVPTTLGGVQVQIKDASGTTRNAPLFYVSPTQISYQNPTGTSLGAANITVMLNGNTVGQGATLVEQVAPGLFTANATGQGVPAAVAIRVKADGTQTTVPILQLNATTNQFDALPLTLGDPTDQVFLVAFGTGFRNRSSLSNATATIGGTNATVSYGGAQGSFLGLDQTNILIPSSLAGTGNTSVVLTVDGKTANAVTLNLQ